MTQELRPAIMMVVLLTLLTGIVYPVAITGVAQVIFPAKANGSLVERDGKVVGSVLIGQVFADEKYFHGRPSATNDADPNDSTKTVDAPYNASNSMGSNLGPTSKALMDRVTAAAKDLKAENNKPIPVDLVTTSSSGLDPDITPAAAEFQIPRIAKARKMSETAVRDVVAQHTYGRTLGFVGEPYVRVLELNMALDDVRK
jgi:potassium-transporting ATPase KdpC subunit